MASLTACGKCGEDSWVCCGCGEIICQDCARSREEDFVSIDGEAFHRLCADSKIEAEHAEEIAAFVGRLELGPTDPLDFIDRKSRAEYRHLCTNYNELLRELNRDDYLDQQKYDALRSRIDAHLSGYEWDDGSVARRRW